MRYIQCSLQWLLEEETMKFVPMSKKATPFDIAVPFCFWNFESKWEHHVATGLEMVGGTLQSSHSVYRKTSDFVLKNMCVTLTQGYAHAVIWFYDIIKNTRSKIELDVNPNRVVHQNKTGKRLMFTEGMAYQIKQDGQERRIYSKFYPQSTITRDFMNIPGLARSGETGPGSKTFCYGVLPHQYSVQYRGKVLDGTSLALVCGPWAILLNDDLTFDTLVCLRGAKHRVLDVESFVYTTNVYVTKILTLWK